MTESYGQAVVKHEEGEMDEKHLERIPDIPKLPQVATSKFRSTQKPVNVLTNLYPITLPRDVVIYKYRIDLTKITPKKAIDLGRGPKQDLPNISRRRVCFSLFYDFMKAGKITAQSKFGVVYDATNTVYCNHSLEEGEFTIGVDECSSSNTKDYLGGNTESVSAKLQQVSQFTMTVGDDSVDANETKQFLDILSSAAIIRRGTHLIYNNKAYNRSTEHDHEKPLIGGKVIKDGAAKSVKRIDGAYGPTLAIQIDPKKSPFFEECSLLDLMVKEIGVRSPRDLAGELRNKRTFKRTAEMIKGLWMETTHMERKRTYDISGLHTNDARGTVFPNNGVDISVYDYFQQKYHMTLKYPDLPLAFARQATSKAYLPIEVLMLPRGQRVTTTKATPDMSEKMIRACQMTPAVLIDNMMCQKEDFELNDSNKFFREFGIIIETQPLVTEGHQLTAPAVKYANNNTIQPGQNGLIDRKAWRTGNYTNAAKLQKWKVINFDRLDNRTIENMVQGLCRQAGRHGMQIDNRPEILHMSSEIQEEIINLFKVSQNKGVQLILGVTKNKMDSVHDVLKRGESLTGVIGQHICLRTAGDIANNKPQTTDNILAKMNTKVGGINHTVEISRQAEMLAQKTGDMSLKQNLNAKACNRMYIGISLSHAGAQTFADRALQVECSIPTVIGMAYTRTNECDFAAESWYQTTRLTSVTNILGRVRLALQAYKLANNRLPDEIIVYRAGASEGEFASVQEEMTELSKAFSIEKGYWPSVTCIVVICGANYRIMPAQIKRDGPAFFQNVMPGTAVDKGITNPWMSEFILTPHGAIQGTSRPIRCTIVEWSKGTRGNLLNLQHLEDLTNLLTYTHQVSTGSVHIPGVLYAAQKVAERGRDQFNFINNNESDTRSMASNGSGGGTIKPNGKADFWEKLSEDHKSRAKNQFWA